LATVKNVIIFYIAVEIIIKQLCLHLLAGVQGRSPCRKSVVILRRVRRPLGAEGSRAAPIYKGGAVPVR